MKDIVEKLQKFTKCCQKDYITDYKVKEEKQITYAQTGGILSMLNPKNWGVKDFSNEGNFNTAYKKAKLQGNEEFMFNGKRFNTEYGGTPNQEVKRYGVNGIPVKNPNTPIVVKKYPMFGKYLPGHIAASTTPVDDNYLTNTVNYGPGGNEPGNIIDLTSQNADTYNVYNADNKTLIKKSSQLLKKNDWNLFTNNCADNVCDGLNLKRSMGITTPIGTVDKIKSNYPTLNVDGRSKYDYMKRIPTEVRSDLSLKNYDSILKKGKSLISTYMDPELSDQSKYVNGLVQAALVEKGYDIKDDGIIGPKTLKALDNYNRGIIPGKMLAKN